MYPFIFVMDVASHTLKCNVHSLTTYFYHCSIFAYHPHSLQLHAETEKAGNAIFLFLHGEEFDPLNLVQR